MSSPRYWWYGIAKRTLAQYQSLRAIMDGSPDRLSRRERQDFNAITRAIEKAKSWKDGRLVLEVVRLHSWEGLTFDQAAQVLYVSEQTAKLKHSRFVYLVAKEMGYDILPDKAKRQR